MPTDPTKKKCFVICPIGAAGSEIRARSDDIYLHLLMPILGELGYEPERAIDNSRPGEITTKVIDDIASADLIVADLTGHNPNVFYELALAHAWGIPLVLFAGDDLAVPFDIAAINVIYFQLGSFGGVDKARAELRKHIKSIQEGRADFQNPVTRHLERSRVKKEGTPSEIKIEALSEEVETLRSHVADLTFRLTALDSSIPPSAYYGPVVSGKPSRQRGGGIVTGIKNYGGGIASALAPGAWTGGGYTNDPHMRPSDISPPEDPMGGHEDE